MSLEEARANFGWTELDVVLVSGDAYIDHPAFGAGLIGRWLERLGLRVGIIAQPDWRKADDFRRLGRPRLFFGVTAGNLDSQLARLTVMRRPRREDQYSPDGQPGLRPDMASVVYCQRLREAFKGDCPPLVLGGVEASLRRIAYYDYWTDQVKRPVLLDAKADILVFGQGELPLKAVVHALQNPASGEGLDGIYGTSVIRKTIADVPRAVELPAWEEVSALDEKGREAFGVMFRKYYANCDPVNGKPVAQRFGGAPPQSGGGRGDGETGGRGANESRQDAGGRRQEQRHENSGAGGHGDGAIQADCATRGGEGDRSSGRDARTTGGTRYVVVYPPMAAPTQQQLDEIYDLPFTRRPHPSYGDARIPCYDMIKDSITTHRGCYADCSFCAITSHQGVAVTSRSQESVLREIETMVSDPAFCGTISDLGGPTANMYATGCSLGRYRCAGKNCLTPVICPHLNTDHAQVLELLTKARHVRGVKHVFVQSGIRFDLALSKGGKQYIEELAEHHTCGRLKIAPEHVSPEVLRHMKKPGVEQYKTFLQKYAAASCAAGKDQYTVQYFISGHPGCELKHMVELALFLKDEHLAPEQVQDYYPAPLTLGMAMWHCGANPITREKVYCAKTDKEKRLQRALFFFRDPDYWPDVREALTLCGREDLIGNGAKCLVPAGRTRRGDGETGRRGETAGVRRR
ncbi:MAG TPA: DUF3362 domain-containing protein [Planctomycetota bacterium]|jgi:radical SAM superfamily enzyme YgiQ (UPF0313 family)